MPTNTYIRPNVKSEQMLYEDLIIESLKTYGQDCYYIPRSQIYEDEILNEDYSRYESSYVIEMYIANTEGFEGEGHLLSKFGIEIRDQATFIVSKLQFEKLVQNESNNIDLVRPREGDLVYLPLSNSLFEIKFVEHEKPFYRLADLPTYQLQCELYEYNSEEFNTGIESVDNFEREYASRVVAQIDGGPFGFEKGESIRQYPGALDGPYVVGEVAKYVPSETDSTAEIEVIGLTNSDETISPVLSPEGSNLYSDTDNSDTEWSIVTIYDLDDEQYIPEDQDPDAQNTTFENEADEIIDFDEDNPFGNP